MSETQAERIYHITERTYPDGRRAYGLSYSMRGPSWCATGNELGTHPTFDEARAAAKFDYDRWSSLQPVSVITTDIEGSQL